MTAQRQTTQLTQTRPASAGVVLQRACACGNHSGAGGECEECKKKRSTMVQRSAVSSPPVGAAPPIVHEVLRAPGQPLDGQARAVLEPRFGHDFSHVRVHSDARAGEAAQAVSARAYTVGQHVVFGAGQYDPASQVGQRLLAHELTHVVQQGPLSAEPAVGTLKIGPTHDRYEQEAARAEISEAARAPTALRRAVLQRQDKTAPQKPVDPMAICYSDAGEPDKPDQCTPKKPENCGSYGDWVASFTRLRSFLARTEPNPKKPEDRKEGDPHTFRVIGDKPAARYPSTAGAADAPPMTEKGGKTVPPTLKLGEDFVDHPTDEWVKTCLPDNLRATAYLLPADCADVAIILRHVWLAAHKRTETFPTWVVDKDTKKTKQVPRTIGDQAGKAAETRVGKIISDVGTGEVANMVNPYSDAKGDPILKFADLEPLLHPGDILVWAHFDNGFDKARTGGHTLTIAGIERNDAGGIESLTCLQGNEPIFGADDPNASDAYDSSDDKGAIIKAAKLKDTKDIRATLGHAPGRRVEFTTLSRSAGDFGATNPATDNSRAVTWRWGSTTLLVAAGPGRAAARPKPKGKQRQITDWNGALSRADASTLTGTIEAMLMEARATIEGGGTISDGDARSLASTAGKRLAQLGKKPKSLGQQPLDERVREIDALFSSLSASRNAFKADKTKDEITARLQQAISTMKQAFDEAVKGEPAKK